MDEHEFYDDDDEGVVVYWQRGDPPEVWPLVRERIIEDERAFYRKQIAQILPDLRWYERAAANCQYQLRALQGAEFSRVDDFRAYWSGQLSKYFDEVWRLRYRLAVEVMGLMRTGQPDYMAECPF